MAKFTSSFLFAGIDHDTEDIYEEEVNDGIAFCAQEQAEAWASALNEEGADATNAAFVKELQQLGQQYSKSSGMGCKTRLQPRFQKGASYYERIASQNESARMADALAAKESLQKNREEMLANCASGFTPYRSVQDDTSVFLEDTTALVLEVGSFFTRAGFAGDDAPRAVCPTIVGRPRHCGVMVGMGQKDSYVGDEAQSKRGILTMKYPVEGSHVTNWDDWEKVMHHIFYNELRVAPEEHAVLMSVNPEATRAEQEKMTQILFETFNVAATVVIPRNSLAMFTSGRTDGLSVHIGNSGVSVVPVFGGAPLLEAARYMTFGGRDITEYLMKVSTERGYSYTTTAEREIVRDIKEKLCYVAQDFDSEMALTARSSQTERSYELPDGQVITMNSELFRAPEVLFQPAFLGLECLGLVDTIYYTIMRCHPDHRDVLWSSIILSGGSSLFTGIKERLEKDLGALLPSTAQLRVFASPSRKYDTWIGGSIFGSLSTCPWYTMDDYNENGPSEFDSKLFTAFAPTSAVPTSSIPEPTPTGTPTAPAVNETKEAEAEEPKKKSSIVRTKEPANVNALLVQTGLCAAEELAHHTGDPVRCTECDAILTSAQQIAGGQWTCAVCGEQSPVDEDDANLPKSDGPISFLLSPPSAAADTGAAPSSTIVFCVDVSGSMDSGVSKSSKTRLQCMKEAVRDQLMLLRDTAPDTKVALISFASNLNFYQVTSRRITQKSVSSSLTQAALIAEGQALATHARSIGEVHENMLKAVSMLRSIDMTALGPAMALSTGVASAFPGSKVILCTDGAANVGMGSLSGGNKFYSEIGNCAKAFGVQLNVIATEGENSGLEHLGTAADLSSGCVEIVNPMDLGALFKNMLKATTVATQVKTTVLLGDGLQFADTQLQTMEIEDGSIASTANVTFALEFTQDALDQLAAYHHAEETEAANLVVPFVDGVGVQVQVELSTADGARKLWVQTIRQLVTVDSLEAEAAVNSTVAAVQAIQASARFAQQGRYADARINLISTQRMLQRTMKTGENQQAYLSFIVQAEKLDQFMREAQAQDQLLGKTSAGYERDDEGAKAMYQMKRVTVAAFNGRC